MGPTPLAFVYFVGVKALGYTAAAPVIKRLYDPEKASAPSVLRVGLTRTAIGVGFGVAYGGAWFFLADKLHLYGSGGTALFFALLLPIRFVEWGILVKLFFDPALADRGRLWKVLIGGSIWSYCLDAIGVGASLVLPGGIWVC
jgi:hypothetical protein